MAKVTSKLQITLPKLIADKFRIRPGDEIQWVAAGERIHVIPPGKHVAAEDRESKLRMFDQATARLKGYLNVLQKKPSRNRGWSREELYIRGRTR